MPQESISPDERTRKIRSQILRAMNEGGRTQREVAEAVGIGEATVNRLLNEHLDNFTGVLAQLGLKVVPHDFKCVDPDTYTFLTRAHQRVMEKAPELIWDAEG